MPTRQQTQGDFGNRPTKVTQGITDVYHAPSIPKPSVEGLNALAQLSKTAMGLIDEQRNLDIAHKKEGLAYGEANPNATLEGGGGLFTRGTTEAAMAGFEQGRGNVLREKFRTNVTNEWATLVEQNEDLKLQEDAYPAFLQQRESEFVQEQGIDGLSLSSFGSGREAWMLDEVHKNNISSIKYRKDVFKTDMKEVTSSAIGNLEHISQLDDLDGSGWMNYIESSFIDENDAGGQVNLPDGSWIGFRDLSTEDFDRVDVRDAMRHQVKDEFVQRNVVPMIQEILQRGYDIGGATEQEVRAAVADDLIASLKSGENPEETMMILNTLQSGTGLFRNTKEFAAKFEENRGAIEDNLIEADYTYMRRIEMFALTEGIDGNTSEESFKKAISQIRTNVGKFLTEEEAFTLETTAIRNWDAAGGQREEMILNGEYVNLAFGGEEGTDSFNQLSASDVSAAFKKTHGITASELEIRKGVEDLIFMEAKQTFGDDLGKQANHIMESIRVNGVFAGTGGHRVKHKIQIAGSQILSIDAPSSMKQVEEAYELYGAAESAGMLSRLGLDKEDVRLYEQLQYLIQYEKATLSQAVQTVDSMKAAFTKDYTSVTSEEVGKALGEVSVGRVSLTMDLAEAIQRQTGQDSETVIAKALELQEELGFTTIGSGANEHPFQLTGNNPTFNAAASSINSAIVSQVREDFDADRQELGEIVRDITGEGQRYGPLNAEWFILTQGASRQRTFLSGFETRILRREFQEEAMERALVIFQEENGRAAMQAQPMFSGVGLEEWDKAATKIGLTSTNDMNLEPVYSVTNLETGVTLDTVGGKDVGANMTADEVLKRFHAETNDYLNAVIDIREKREIEMLQFIDRSVK
tara:strand:- start:689 stop:3280 length:2592 start_codon:yes stop_codon:yes gene_type:complete